MLVCDLGELHVKDLRAGMPLEEVDEEVYWDLLGVSYEAVVELEASVVGFVELLELVEQLKVGTDIHYEL